MSKYSVLVVGMGKRGMHHATAFNANPKFQVAGICDIDPEAPRCRRRQARQPAKGHRRRRTGQGGQARRLLLLHAAQPAHADDQGGDRRAAQSSSPSRSPSP